MVDLFSHTPITPMTICSREWQKGTTLIVDLQAYHCHIIYLISIMNAHLPESLLIYLPIVKNNLSPTSPNPGLIIPLASTSLSIPPTHTSTPSIPFSSAALLTPLSLPNTLISTTFFTPHSCSV